jgi:TolB-like protein
MKTKILLILPLLVSTLAAVTAPAASLTVAVYDFKGDVNTADLGRKVTTLVTADLTTETNLVLLERADLSKILNEQAFDISGMVSSDAAAKIGQVTGVKVLVAGEVLKTDENHLVIIANIIGTETGRLFAVKTDGAADSLMKLTSDLSHKIATSISLQKANLLAPPTESHEAIVDRIVKSIQGTNRPSVSVHILQYNRYGNRWPDGVAETEFSKILLKAGFKVLDENADERPDIKITGDATTSWGESHPHPGDLTSIHASIEIEVRERKTGKIVTLDNQEAVATGVGETVVDRTSQIKAVDALAERLLPLLAK